VSQLALAHETDQLSPDCCVRLTTATAVPGGKEMEEDGGGGAKLRIKIKHGEKDDFKDLDEPFSNTSPLNV